MRAAPSRLELCCAEAVIIEELLDLEPASESKYLNQ